MFSRTLLVAAVLLPGSAMAQVPGQFAPQPQFVAPNVVVTPPAFGFGGGGYGTSSPLPFETQQTQQQRLLETLDTGGIERPAPSTRPPGCIYAGQIYSEGAVVTPTNGERQTCVPRPGAEPDLSGQRPLAWQSMGR